jgi:hypothetical protein
MNFLYTVDGYSVTPLAPIVLFGWVPFAIFLFFVAPPRRAILIIVVAGFLLLPMARYDLPGFNNFNKNSAIALGLLIGSILSGHSRSRPLHFGWKDLPMLLWCFVSPVATSLANGLGLYDGVSGSVQNFLHWGVFFWVGRRFFQKENELRDLVKAVLFGGILYLFLVLFEIRMSPQLSNIVYGFFPHDWIQHWRYGWYRPIVFMQHGLMVALWMAVTTIIAYWLWREKIISKMFGVPFGFWVVIMIITAVLCRSANGWVFLTVGIVLYSLGKKFSIRRMLKVLLLVIPFYMVVRLASLVAVEDIRDVAAVFFDENRVLSLMIRLRQELNFGTRALQRPLFGWGGYGRGWPVDPLTGQRLVTVIDSLWIILISTYGLLGLSSVFISLGIGPWCSIARLRLDKNRITKKIENYQIYILVLSITMIIFLLDSLMNAMINSIYIVIAGALVSVCEEAKNKNMIESIIR